MEREGMNVTCLFEAGINNTIIAEGWLLASDYIHSLGMN